MNKNERFLLIQKLAKQGKRSVSVLLPSESEVKEEIQLAKVANDNESIADEDLNLIPSVEILSRTKAQRDIDSAREASTHEEGYMLNKREKVELAADLAVYRLANPLPISQPVELVETE